MEGMAELEASAWSAPSTAMRGGEAIQQFLEK